MPQGPTLTRNLPPKSSVHCMTRTDQVRHLMTFIVEPTRNVYSLYLIFLP